MSFLDELLADYTAGDANAQPAPAKAANSAKSERPCGPALHSDACEGLRISAKAPTDSQLFAGIRNPENTPRSEHSCGLSQDSQVSQGRPATNASNDATGWRITLAPGIQPETVATFRAESLALGRQIAEAGEVVDPDRWCWPNDPRIDAPMNTAEVATFTARVLRFTRSGLTPPAADRLAERLTRRDRELDERRACPECMHFRRGRCGNHVVAELGSPELGDMATRLQRCPGFVDGGAS